MRIFWLTFSGIFLLALHSAAQEDTICINTSYHGLSWERFVAELENKRDLTFFYHRDSLTGQTMEVKGDKVPLMKVLTGNLSPKGFRVYSDGRGNYFCYKNLDLQTGLAADFFQKPESALQKTARSDTSVNQQSGKQYLQTFEDYVTEQVTFGSPTNQQSMGTDALLSGFITDEDGEPIPQATLHVKEINRYTATDVTGYYSFELNPGEYTLSVKSLGSHEKKYRLKIYADGRLDISLKTKTYMLQETVITADRHDNVRTTQMGIEKIQTRMMKELPVVMGERDIVKLALMLPGVQSVSEASSGFNVRGSPSDQNMFYINNLPVYNVSHLFGMFTAFHPDAIKDFSLYKSNIPVEHGGRLSSIFDIEAKQGNMKEFSARGGISPVTSRIMAEGPLKKDTSSYLVGIRSTYSDWILNEIKEPSIRNSSVHFADALVHLTHRSSASNQWNFLAYGSLDRSDLDIGLENEYSNAGASLQWRHAFSPRHRFTMDLLHTNYHFREVNDEVAYSSSQQSFDLNHSELKLDFAWNTRGNHQLEYGLNAVHYYLNQGDFNPLNDNSSLKPIAFEPERSVRASLFISDEWKLTNDLTLTGGLRATQYTFLGPQTSYTYPANQPREPGNITDTTTYGFYETIDNHFGLDYRLSAKYMMSNTLSVKAGVNQLHQYIFLMSNTLSPSPTDQWKLADQHLQPMKGLQYSLGLYKNITRANLELSAEGYYKTVDNLVETKDGANLLYNKFPETDVIQGSLKAYGVEFMLKKTAGNLNGWLNYTYSRTSVKAVDQARGERNNLGFSYPANYDKPHAANLSLNYRFTKRWSLSTNVVYATGRPITYPKSVYYQRGIQITGFSQRNESRLPDYFRADLSINYEGNLKKNKFAHGSWSFSLYNITGRKNPYSVYFRNEGGQLQGYKLSIFGTMIPSITYNLKLGNYED